MFKRILVPVDGSQTSNKALVTALGLARECGAVVRLMHAIDDLALISGYDYSIDLIPIARAHAHKLLADAMAIAGSAGIDADSILAEIPGVRLGETVAIQAREWRADLIVLGTHGRKGLGRVLLGSGAEQIMRTAPVPVLVVRGDE
ncbi:universal stress protein UspA-like protein [Acidovorax sp. CF316]|uniref:universal stress protein n=1 Tax=Acidovorax sp. CF316 TaxID=1144317 RepID=UPI00026BEBC7|nr:universal stress protein [Acidovorax sp. CF316]EJE54695.1 universal stress protein UspA-like protein [Acidovorax sp. CF316]